ASPRGLVRHSSLPKPNTPVPWEVVADEEPLEGTSAPCPDACYDPEGILALIYTSGTTGRPKGVVLTHSNILSNVHNSNYWMRYREGGVYLHAAPIFHITDSRPCSPRRRSARASSHCRASARRPSAPRLKRSESTTPCWCSP